MLRIGIDIGGTFTDFVVFDARSGSYYTRKVLSTPGDPAQAVLSGLAQLGELPDGPSIVHGSTVATNAVLERKGARAAMVSTRGFRDVLSIGRQARPDLYDFYADPPQPIVPPEWCFEVSERVSHQGEVLKPIDPASIDSLLDRLRETEVESIAVCFLFSFLHPEHEAAVASRLRDAGYFVSVSSEILPEFREYERSSTTALNAYVTPVLDRYLGRLDRELTGASLRIMQSNGGSATASAARQQGVRSILSGPAGGVVGALHVARSAGFNDVITFDMGGTSTDVSLARGEPRVTSEAEIGGLPIRVPVIDLHTVGSGGGSLATVDAGGALRVGPESAGSDPGPACYGLGGTRATVTDANVVLGRLPSDHFLGGEMPLDMAAATAALDALARAARIEAEGGLSARQRAALGVLKVANAHMERALRVISVERGHDPADFTLLSFGGAGGLHAVSLARSLQIGRVVVPPEASTLSALGMLIAPVVKDYVQTIMQSGPVAYRELEEQMAPLAETGRAEVRAEGVDEAFITLHPELDLRYQGQSYELSVPLVPDYRRQFDARHQGLYGHADSEAPVEIVNLRLRSVGAVTPLPLPESAVSGGDPAAAILDRRAVTLEHEGIVPDVPLYEGEGLVPGQRLQGPAVVVRRDTTIFLDSGGVAEVDRFFNLIVTPS